MSTRLVLRVAAPSAVIGSLLLLLGGLGGWYVHQLQKSTAAAVALDFSTLQAVQRLVLSIQEMRTELTEFLQTGDEAHLRAVPKKCDQVEQWLDEAERLVDVAPKTGFVAHLRYGCKLFRDEFNRLAKAPANDKRRRDIQQLCDQLALQDILTPAQKLLALAEKVGHQNSDYNQALAGRVALFLWALGVCGAVAGLVAGYGIARSLGRSIVELYVPIQAASGRLEEVIGPVDVAPSAGIEHLDVILRRMADYVGTVVDRLRQSQLELLRREQMAALGQLSAGLAHELRNPLTAMKILVQTAMKAGPSATLSGQDLAVVAAETARLERSIQAFLDFARPPALEKSRGDVRQALQQTLDLVRARADQQRVEVCCRLPGHALMMEADHEQLRQLFLNLLLNALDMLPSGGRIEISGSLAGQPVLPAGDATVPAREDRTPWMMITVADNGPGIPADLGERIFEPYVSTKETGLGLGLAVCRRIVESHGGQITAENLSGGGAAFTVRLPCEEGGWG
jgi:signal transduction histidine kinase